MFPDTSFSIWQSETSSHTAACLSERTHSFFFKLCGVIRSLRTLITFLTFLNIQFNAKCAGKIPWDVIKQFTKKMKDDILLVIEFSDYCHEQLALQINILIEDATCSIVFATILSQTMYCSFHKCNIEHTQNNIFKIVKAVICLAHCNASQSLVSFVKLLYYLWK